MLMGFVVFIGFIEVAKTFFNVQHETMVYELAFLPDSNVPQHNIYSLIHINTIIIHFIYYTFYCTNEIVSN